MEIGLGARHSQASARHQKPITVMFLFGQFVIKRLDLPFAPPLDLADFFFLWEAFSLVILEPGRLDL